MTDVRSLDFTSLFPGSSIRSASDIRCTVRLQIATSLSRAVHNRARASAEDAGCCCDNARSSTSSVIPAMQLVTIRDATSR